MRRLVIVLALLLALGSVAALAEERRATPPEDVIACEDGDWLIQVWQDDGGGSACLLPGGSLTTMTRGGMQVTVTLWPDERLVQVTVLPPDPAATPTCAALTKEWC